MEGHALKEEVDPQVLKDVSFPLLGFPTAPTTPAGMEQLEFRWLE